MEKLKLKDNVKHRDLIGVEISGTQNKRKEEQGVCKWLFPLCMWSEWGQSMCVCTPVSVPTAPQCRAKSPNPTMLGTPWDPSQTHTHWLGTSQGSSQVFVQNILVVLDEGSDTLHEATTQMKLFRSTNFVPENLYKLLVIYGNCDLTWCSVLTSEILSGMRPHITIQHVCS